MTKRLLIDASHAEETRVVVLDGNRLEDFDVETLSRRQLKGNIYLAKVVRVEPSLQAAFVEYGGNRHGFLAFGEIHPDYYQIPVADRQHLLQMQEDEARAQEEAEEAEAIASEPSSVGTLSSSTLPTMEHASEADVAAQPLLVARDALADETDLFEKTSEATDQDLPDSPPDLSGQAAERETDTAPELGESAGLSLDDDPQPALADTVSGQTDEIESADISGTEPLQQDGADDALEGVSGRVRLINGSEASTPEIVGGDADVAEETRAPRQPSRFTRNYKIQEVIRRRQILLIQVVKEERGTKGAALTTYISLAGRYCVLMPNSPRGGGISRKITSVADRRRLKEVTAELEIPRGMGLIVRTAGAARPKAEIKRDGEYLLRLWDDIREKTMQSMAPSLIHEEASLIKRAIRDVYSRDVDELLVDGQDGWRAARDYMRVLMPTHVKKVQLWPANAQPLFAFNQVESMLDSMLNPTVQLRSGGYLVINQTEALVAIDVNSGRSTRERGIEETALRTNLEAAEEAARQLRLRDLAGLIVIDFIDMESKKHNGMVERRIADALRHDRARIQVGHISHFGLLELSRQRLRPSLAETSLTVCAQCGGNGHVRSTESSALHVLREIEEMGGRRRAAEILVHVASSTALYILNNKRQRLTEIEGRYGMTVSFSADESMLPAQTRIDCVRAALPQDLPTLPIPRAQPMPDDDADEADIADDEDDLETGQTRVEAGASAGETVERDFTTDADHVPGETAAEGEQRRRRRRRRRRGGKREDGLTTEAAMPIPDGADQPDIPELDVFDDLNAVPGRDGASEAEFSNAVDASDFPVKPAEIDMAADALATNAIQIDSESDQARAKRGRRGGRRRRKPGEPNESTPVDAAELSAPPPATAFPTYVGPTPADPFALASLDIFDALEQAELSSAVIAEAPQPPPDFDQQTQAGPFETEPDEPVAATDAPRPVEVEKLSPEQPLQEEPVATAAKPATAPPVQPKLVGIDVPTTERKKGWWRR